MDQNEYEQLKLEVRGFYFKFNTQVLKWHMSKIFDYEYLLDTAKVFESFEEFYVYHIESKDNLIKKHIDKMFFEASKKGLNPTKELIKKCIIVRLGNIYNGMYIENKILETFKNLEPWIFCEKTNKDTDTTFKVDAIITIQSLGQIAIQIKPVSFTKYDNGSENSSHNRFTIDSGIDVYYVLYKDRDTIIFNGEEILLTNLEKIVEIIEKLVNSN